MMVNGQFLVNWWRSFSFFTARGAAHTFTYSQWRVKRWLQKTRVARSYDVDMGELLGSLELVKGAAEENRESALLELTAHYRSRSSPILREPEIARTIERIPSELKERTVRSAELICQNIFDLRGVGPVKFDGKIDWDYCPGGNVDWRWDLNRHVFFETLGRAYWYTRDERYGYKFKELLCDWLAENPARADHLNWASVFEVAFRINVWIWALEHFRKARAFDAELLPKLLAGLLAHGRYLNANLELHVPNNHLLLEAKALALLGIAVPEFKEARRWRERGFEVLEREVRAQVCKDGVHGERTTLYHRVIAGELLELLVVMENNRIPAPASLVQRFEKMVEFEVALAKPDGTFPLLGDSAAADTHLRFPASSGGPIFLRRDDLALAQPLQEADYWLLGAGRIGEWQGKRTTKTFGSVAFPMGGYYVMNAGEGADARYLVFDCGPFGLPAMPNHGHADALSMEVYALGQTLLVDPGFYSTALGLDWRNFFRGSRSHNTVVVDGLDQSHLMDERRVYRPARAICLGWKSNDEFDFVDGMHNGYERLAQPITHRRQVLFVKPHYWVIVDVLTGRGKHAIDLYFHMMPGARTVTDPEANGIRVENQGGAGLAIVPLSDGKWEREIVTGATSPIQGWVSFFSGEKTPAPVLRLRQEVRTPVQFCTVLYPFRIGEEPSVKVLPLRVEGRAADDPTLTAIRIETPNQVDSLIIDRANSASRKGLGDPKTPARVEFKSRKKSASGL